MSAETNFMDFSDAGASGTRAITLSRPRLSTEKQTTYEDTGRSAQALREMHRFYRDERLCDVVIRGDGARFPCHRLVLAATSLYFERMFSNDMSEARSTEITINDVTSTALQHLIEFAYTSSLSVHTHSVLEIFEAADMLQFATARTFCEDFLLFQVDKNNCLSFLVYADAFSCKLLYQKAKLCAARNFKSICKTPAFLSMPFCHLVSLLKEDGIEMAYEEHIFEAMKRWIVHDTENRSRRLLELMKCVRLNFVSRWYLIEVISKDDLIRRCPATQAYIQSAKDQLLAQGHTYEIPWQLPPSRSVTGLTDKIVYIDTGDPTLALPAESRLHLFDPVNKSWSSVRRSGPLAVSTRATCETLGDVLLVIGGWDSGDAAAAKTLNQRTGAVSTVHEFKVMSIFPTLWYVGAHDMGVSRYDHSTVTAGTQLYLLGGYDETHTLQATVYVTDAASNYHFESCSRMLYALSRAAVVHHSERLYVFGGYDGGGTARRALQSFDMNTGQWTEVTSSVDDVPMSCQYAVCIDELIYVVTGEATSGGRPDATTGSVVKRRCADSLYTFNPRTLQWCHLARLPEPPHTGSFCATTLGGRIYLTGGLRGGRPYFAVDCFNVADNTVETVGNTAEGSLSLCSTIRVMHENFGL